MTSGTPWKHILGFSIPVVAGSLLQQLYNTVDAIVVGRFAGEAALSAVGTTGSFAFLFLAMTYLFRYSSFMGYKVIWLNGYYGLGVGFMITWTFYLSGVWKKGLKIKGGSEA